MADTINELESEILSELATLKASLGGDTPLSQAEKNVVSYAVDAKNEAWNGGLGERPH